MTTIPNINDIIARIKKVGANSVRPVPMPGQRVDGGSYQIEVLEDGSWVVAATGMPKHIAEDIISQATNRVILG